MSKSARSKKAQRNIDYEKNKVKVLSEQKEYYQKNAEIIKIKYHANPEAKKAASRADSKARYNRDPKGKKAASCTNYYKYKYQKLPNLCQNAKE